MSTNKEKAKIFKESLVIIDKLGKLDDELDNDDIEEVKELIKKAKRLVRNRNWKLY